MSENQQNHKSKSGLNTPYDDAFKSILSKCPRLAIFLVNEMFFANGLSDEKYTGLENVIMLDKEIPNVDMANRIRDSRFAIMGMIPREYHLECQSTTDGTVILRMVRYGMTGAVETAQYDQGIIHVKLDDSGIVFLRSTKETPDMMTVILSIPQNQSVTYQIPVLKIKDYTLDDIWEKNLFILIPFIFFNYESKLKKAKDNEEIFNEINTAYATIVSELQMKAELNLITAYEASILFDALKIVFDALGTTNHAEEEVDKIMGGKVLEFSADKYFRDGEAKGIEIGEARGIEIGEARGIEIGEARGETKGEAKGVDLAMDLVSELVLSENYEELIRMAKNREYTKQKVQLFKEG